MRGGGRQHGRRGRGGGRGGGEDGRVGRRPLLSLGLLLSVRRPVEQRPLLPLLSTLGEGSVHHGVHVVPQAAALREPAVHLQLGQPGLLSQLVCSGTHTGEGQRVTPATDMRSQPSTLTPTCVYMHSKVGLRQQFELLVKSDFSSLFTCSRGIRITEGRTCPFPTLEGGLSHYRRLTSGYL